MGFYGHKEKNRGPKIMLKWGLTWYDFKDKSNTICTFYFRSIYVLKMRSKARITMGMDVGELEEEKPKDEIHNHLLKFTILNLKKKIKKSQQQPSANTILGPNLTTFVRCLKNNGNLIK
jgi:hypothetical protein